jgi:putative nucleotidyltransferase with HDIG domain
MADDVTFVKTMTHLPTPVPVLRHIAVVTLAADAAIDRVVEAIRQDPAVAGKVLRLANSAFTGIPGRISSLQNAVSLLGIPRVRSLVIASQFVNNAAPERPMPVSIERLWRHSTLCACIAGSIGHHLKRYGPVDDNELYSAALLHDIGKLVLAVHAPERLTGACLRSEKDAVPFYKAEDPGLPHTRAGALLADQWGFPPELLSAIAGHHEPARHKGHFRFVAIVHVADYMAHVLGFPVVKTEVAPPLDRAAFEAVPLPLERLKIIAESEIENMKRIEKMCGMEKCGISLTDVSLQLKKDRT